jgi:hypothetical protein
MIYLIWLLRIIHIVGGVFWVGGSLIMTFFVAPTLAATGENGNITEANGNVFDDIDCDTHPVGRLYGNRSLHVIKSDSPRN